jgi:hypothetical protein
MDRIVRAFRVLPGKEDQLQALAEALEERSEETRTFYEKYDVVQESWHIQDTGDGTLVIAITYFDSPDTAAATAAYRDSEDAFDTWFREQVRQICGVDPREEPLGPLTRCIFEWGGDAKLTRS